MYQKEGTMISNVDDLAQKESLLYKAKVEGGDGSDSSGEGSFKMTEEITYPSLDEALSMKFDLNNVTSIN
jgi:hypothetical protein